MARPRQNLYGQEMGTKGTLTRARIVAATAHLMQRRPLRDLRVAEIGKVAAVSPSTFYLYFESVADAGLAAVGEIRQATPKAMAVLDSEWTLDNCLERAKAFVQVHLEVWDANHALLRVRNFMADEGDKRFFEVRRVAMEPIHLAIQRKVEVMQADLPADWQLDPPSTASILLAMLERFGALVRLPSSRGATRPRQIQAAAFAIASTIAGGLPRREAGAAPAPATRKPGARGQRLEVALED